MRRIFVAGGAGVVATGMVADLVHPITGPQRVVGPLVRMSRTPSSASRSAPPLGYHTREILGEAGFAASEIDSLVEARVVSDGD